MQTMSFQRGHQTEVVQKNLNQTEMAESEGIKGIVSQVVVQAVTAVMIVVRDAHDVPRPVANTASPKEQKRYMTD